MVLLKMSMSDKFTYQSPALKAKMVIARFMGYPVAFRDYTGELYSGPIIFRSPRLKDNEHRKFLKEMNKHRK